MSTRSTISIHQKDGNIRTVYCHFDGYYEHNGVILYNFYNTSEKVNALIDNGAISSLGTIIGKKHDFYGVHHDCTFYHRDRGEKKEIWESKIYEGENPYKHLLKDNEDFNYIFVEKTGEWLVNNWDEEYEKLEEAFRKKADFNVWMILVNNQEQYQKLLNFYKEFGHPDMKIPDFKEVVYEV